MSHLPLFIGHYLVASNYKWKMGQMFVTFSEYPNFTYWRYNLVHESGWDNAPLSHDIQHILFGFCPKFAKVGQWWDNGIKCGVGSVEGIFWKKCWWEWHHFFLLAALMKWSLLVYLSFDCIISLSNQLLSHHYVLSTVVLESVELSTKQFLLKW